MYKLIDGKAVAAEIRARIADKVTHLSTRRPCLAVIVAGDDPACAVYVRNKKADCEKVGFISREYPFGSYVTQEELISLINELNADATVDGILVQSPLPRHLDERACFEAILPDKDVDGFHTVNSGRLFCGLPCLSPCTALGVMRLLEYYGIAVAGKECVVVGRSNIVGKPLALMLLAANGTVTVCHSRTADLESVTRRADILIAATGRAGLITASMVKDGAVVIDVGITRTESGLRGDVDFDSVSAKAAYITPVPGGVGPMTRAILLENTFNAYLSHTGGAERK